ncbi:MAG: hypothetical protein AAGF24_15815, partial [Cyanobacteria bacterium P01_H01_bin.121]
LMAPNRNNPNRICLIGERNPHWLQMLSQPLKQLDYLVLVARSSQEFAEMAQVIQPTILLLNPTLAVDPLDQVEGTVAADWLEPLLANAGTVIRLVDRDRQEQPELWPAGLSEAVPLVLPTEPETLRASLQQALGRATTSPSQRPTLLWLRPDLGSESPLQPLLPELTSRYRILEADELAQAELLHDIGHCEVLVLNMQRTDSLYDQLLQLESTQAIAQLPWVTLTAAAQALANALQHSNCAACPLPKLTDSNLTLERSALDAWLQRFTEAIQAAVFATGDPA